VGRYCVPLRDAADFRHQCRVALLPICGVNVKFVATRMNGGIAPVNEMLIVDDSTGVVQREHAICAWQHGVRSWHFDDGFV
jgi:hypothetical protein